VREQEVSAGHRHRHTRNANKSLMKSPHTHTHTQSHLGSFKSWVRASWKCRPQAASGPKLNSGGVAKGRLPSQKINVH